MALLALLSVGLAFVPVPGSWHDIVTGALSVIYISVPVFAMYRAGDHRWTPKFAALFIACGLVVHVGLALISSRLEDKGIASAIFVALSQTGLIIWCAGLGALLATLLKEKNLLIPVSLFLAAFDIFLVLTPIGPTQTILNLQPQVLPAIGWRIPAVSETPAFGPVAATAHIGPADFLFMAFFFVALFRFEMRTRETVLWLIPTLIAYMAVVFAFGPLPALVPIGLCVLIVNWKEFRLTAQEWTSTAVVAVLGGLIVLWGATRPGPQAEPLQPGAGQGSPAPADSPSPSVQAPPQF